jgi:uncharacterized protein (DUF4415 family)
VLAKAAPPSQDEATVNARLDKAVAVNGGGIKAVREAMAKRVRGPGKKARRVAISLRIEPEALERWKASGPGWQTRMGEALNKLAP